MKKHIGFSLIIVFIGLLSSGDGIIISLGSLIVIPLVLLLQFWVYFIFKKFKVKISICKLCSLLPASLFMIWALFSISTFAKATNIFEITMKAKKPSSVNNLHVWDDSWTDYMAELYCEIAPHDLRQIIKNSGFEKEKHISQFVKEKSLSDSRIEYLRDKPPIKNLVVYKRQVGEGKGWISLCTVYTNQKHNRMFVTYGAN